MPAARHRRLGDRCREQGLYPVGAVAEESAACLVLDESVLEQSAAGLEHRKVLLVLGSVAEEPALEQSVACSEEGFEHQTLGPAYLLLAFADHRPALPCQCRRLPDPRRPRGRRQKNRR